MYSLGLLMYIDCENCTTGYCCTDKFIVAGGRYSGDMY
jgi:hypothetical protein